MDIFKGKAPWVPHTPQARMVNRQVEINQGEEQTQLAPIPPAPTLPQPPSAAPKEGLNADQAKVLSHLRALQGLGCALPDNLQQHLESLETKEKEVTPTLSHGHLNRLKKIQSQQLAISKKIASTDQDWQRFVAGVMSKIQEHATWYQEHRSQLLAQFTQKGQELEEAKREVSQASLCLVEGALGPAEPAPTQAPTQDLANIQQLAQSLVTPHIVNLEEVDPEEENMETGSPSEPQEGSEEATGRKEAREAREKKSLRPFQQNRSPKQVAQHNLKK